MSACMSCGGDGVAAGRVLCRACEWELVESIRTCVYTAGPLMECAYRQASRRGHSLTDGLKGAGRASAPCPMSMPHFEALSALGRLAGEACVAVGVTPTNALEGDLRAILGRVSMLATACSEERGDAAEWLAEWRDMARRVTRLLDPQVARVCLGACPACGSPVWAEQGARYGRCACGVASTAAQCAAARAARLDLDGVWTKPAEMSRRLASEGVRCPAATIRSWCRRGRVKTDAEGRVSAADIVALLRKKACG